MEYRLNINEKKVLSIRAKEPYSSEYLLVNKEEKYVFTVEDSERWKDWFINSDVNGFNNWFLRNKDKRVPGSKCFKLCGTIDRNEENHFSIGKRGLYNVVKNGELYFFANDSKKINKKGQFKYYRNNKKTINLLIQRIQ